MNFNILSRIRCILPAALFLLTAFTASAQVGEPRNEIAIGFNAGVGLNKMSFVPTIRQHFYTGPTAGLTFRYTCEKYFKVVCALQAELNYTRLGWKEDIVSANDAPLPDTYQRDLNYVQFPFMARLAMGREVRGAMGYLLLGPQVGWCFGDSERKSSQWTLNGAGLPDRPNNMSSQYGMSVERKFDYGITGGLGVELHTKIGHFMIDGRYYYALGDIFNNGKRDVFARSAHGTIIAKFTYLFNVRSDKTPRK